MMGSVCAEQQHHKFHHSHQLHHLTKKPSPLRDIDIPPRKKLLAPRRRLSPSADAMDSPNTEASAVFSRFLPCNNNPDEDDPYSSDHFRIYEFKIRKCNRSRSHDWTDCPFAHPGEKARRRDPSRFRYSGTVCPDFRKGSCVRGDACQFSHGVFECWLHPSRYRTEACKDGKHCKRKVCFFAHSSKQLRIVPESPPSPPPADRKSYCHNKNKNNAGGDHLNFNRNCCVFCRPTAASPTSTLMGCMSQLSPPASPLFSPFDRRRAGLHEFVSASGLSYEEALAELMASYEAMSLVEAVGPAPSKLFRGGFSGGRNLMDDERYNTSGGSSSGPNLGGPDLGWVNDLLT